MFSLCNMIKLVLLSFAVASLKCCCADTVFYDDMGYSCDVRSDDSTTADFKTNLNSLLSTLEKKGPENYGFYMAATGVAPDRIYGLVQCRGDVSTQDCATCLSDSVKSARKRCNNSNAAVIWLNWCSLRYSDQNFLGQGNLGINALIVTKNTTDDPIVTEKGKNLLSLLSSDVPNQPFLFQPGSVDVGNNGTRYGLVQCNRDLSKSTCKDCTVALLEFYNRLIGNQSSYLVYSYSCRMWYDTYKFYFNYTLPSVAPNDIPIPTGSSMQLRLSISSTITVLLSLLVSSSAL